MPINPFSGLEEENLDPLTGLPKSQSFSPEMLKVAALTPTPRDRGAIDGPSAPAISEPSDDMIEEPSPIAPNIRDYLLKRKAEREGVVDDNSGFDTRGAITGALSSLGAAFQGKDSIAAGMGALDRSAKMRKDAISTFDKDTERGQAENLAMVEDDPNSEESKLADQLARRMGYKGAPVTATKFKAFSPAMEKMYDIEQRRLDREEARAERRSLADIARQDRLDARSDKKKELSATQAKQRGLYEMGKTAEEQYTNASGSKDYDPTSYMEFLDNDKTGYVPNWAKSGKAVEAQSAQNSWIESYLRDASGAAIPNSERAAYAGIYFPQPGDSADTVKNKAALRAQKQDSARIAAGVETGHGPAVAERPGAGKTITKTQTNKRTGEKRIVYSDGTSEIVPGAIAGR